MPRLIEIIVSLLIMAARILIQGKSDDKEVNKSLSKLLLKTLTNLGPCFIKVGQSLSTRPDLIRRDWLEELTNLQDNLPPCSHEQAMKMLEDELGAAPNKLFEYFPNKPIASASLGQVYKARLKDNYWVAVKIQRPNLEYIIRRDLVIIRVLGIFASPILPLNLGFGLEEIIDEFGKTLFEEIDYELEACNAERFTKLFANNPAITIPIVERSVSSRKVITTSWIDGTKLKDRNELIEQSLDPAALIKTGVISGIQQLLEFGYFHADPHPGNMFALEGKSNDLGNIAYVDFGMMDSISDNDRLTLTGAIVHLINEDYEELSRDFQRLGFLSKDKDPLPIAPVLKEVLGEALGEEVVSFNFKAITDKFSELMFDYPFRVPARFALIIRAVVSQEGLALNLDPQFKILGVAYPYVAKRLLAAETKEMLELLLEVIFNEKGDIRIDRIESLLDVLTKEEKINQSAIIPAAISAIRLLLSKNGSKLRKNLLLTLIKDDQISFRDLNSIINLVTSKINSKQFAKGLIQTLNPLTV